MGSDQARVFAVGGAALLLPFLWGTHVAFAQPPSHAMSPAHAPLCTMVAPTSVERVGDWTVMGGDFDVDGDGVAEHVEHDGDWGTVHQPQFRITDSAGQVHELISPGPDQGGGYGARWFVHSGHGYLLSFGSADGRYLEAAFALTRGYRLQPICGFENIVHRTFGPLREADGPICQASEAEAPFVENEARGVSGGPNWRREDNVTSVGPALTVLFANDGKQTKLVPVVIDNEAGRSCHYNYFRLAKESGSPADRHYKELLESVQERDVYSRNGLYACPANRLTWFVFQGKTYSRSRPIVAKQSEEIDSGDRLDGAVNGVPRRICQASYSVRWKPRTGTAAPQDGH